MILATIFLFHALERRLWGGARESSIASNFLSDIPTDLIEGDIPLTGGTSLRRDQHLERLTRIDRATNPNKRNYEATNAVRKKFSGPMPGKAWEIGDIVIHSFFGAGKVTHIFGKNEKISLAIKFDGMSPKILDPRLAPIKLIKDN